MIEDHVVNLELSKKLHELGVTKDSIFSWDYDKGSHKWSVRWDEFREEKPDQISAYTASELMEILPFDSEEFGNLNIGYYQEDNSYEVNYIHNNIIDPEFNGKNLSNQLAKMLIYVIEKGTIKIEEVKE